LRFIYGNEHVFVLYATTASGVILQENEEHAAINVDFWYLCNVDDCIPWKCRSVLNLHHVHVKRVRILKILLQSTEISDQLAQFLKIGRTEI
jgi:hypothetical protein